MNTKRCLTIFSLIPLLIGLSACNQGISNVVSVSGKPVHVERSFAAAEVSRIDVRTKAANVQFKAGSGEHIQVQVNGKFDGSEDEMDELLNTTLKRGQLAIKVGPVEGKVWNNTSLTVEVAVPAKLYDELKLEASSGNITADKVEAGKLSAQSSSGNINVKGYSGKEYQVAASSGNIHLEKMTGKGNVEASSGNVDMEIDSFDESVRVHTSSGNATIRVRSDAVFRIVADTKLDRADLNIPVTLEQKEGKRKFKASVNQATSDSPVLDVTTSSGKMILEKIK
ncbi:DUF4097 family beta strand repeat-containing protein [Paenibacillus alvei]|uniref:DUF4097 family beta strand repeat-containing protein n=1 Tax=Paenibacillus alvei TaxID=44250 RepID=UPI0018CE3232|nr:DUF4097 family beta strand repeat-containing protein [Paenibacillus alvei]MBG9737353.1 hypothetical protein [Paenibacillus alvei]MBG9746104.1 hypothetical protein [Paenibacillus alvei]MCY9579114.1 DUF4097 domain-containing protein [Paenibacillus alvei]MCY9583541.1 DUF4097 domain-containing protein [Paenibacillus alvei]